MDTRDLIDWESSQSHFLLNPRMPQEQRSFILDSLRSIPSLPGHIWLMTSGSSGATKCVALSKEAILHSAAAVNTHLECSSADIWINPLPTFHVGGLAIKARGYLKEAHVHEFRSPEGKWDPIQFVNETCELKASLTALVPAQLFDLIKEGLASPPFLRAVVIGGGAINEKVYQQAIELGWKVLPSYGLTECCSQVATAHLDSVGKGGFPLLKPLDHVEISTNHDERLLIKSDSLLTCYVFIDQKRRTCSMMDPKVDRWFLTEDKVVIEEGGIRTISRENNFVKIGGESVDLLRLENILEEIKILLKEEKDMTIVAFPDERLGHVIHLAVAGGEEGEGVAGVVKMFNERVHPYERIRQIRFVSRIPRTALNKVIRTAFFA